MEYKEYGSKNNDIIILLHGGGLSWWNYIDEISLLENEFHIVIPILDGHSGSDTNFTSIESNALEIINFINKNYNGKVKLIGGLSLGGQILLEILSKNPNICECAIIESALIIPMDFTYKMIEPIFNLSYCLISKKWFSKLQFKSLKLKKSLFALYYEDTCKITKDNLIANCNNKLSLQLVRGLLIEEDPVQSRREPQASDETGPERGVKQQISGPFLPRMLHPEYGTPESFAEDRWPTAPR